MEAAFDKFETCSCCGRDVKRPRVFRGRRYGSACKNVIDCIRLRLALGEGVMGATKEARIMRPRTWENSLAHALAPRGAL